MSDMFEIERLREGLIKAALEAETLRAQLAEAQARIEKLEAQSHERLVMLRKADERANGYKAKNARLEAALNAARDLLAEKVVQERYTKVELAAFMIVVEALQAAPSEAPASEVTLTDSEIEEDEPLEKCEVCGGDGWLLEPVEGYKPRQIRCKYCDGTGNQFGIPSEYSPKDNIA